jgi:Protein of unknown function VcgC/VcgE (DUF2780)
MIHRNVVVRTTFAVVIWSILCSCTSTPSIPGGLSLDNPLLSSLTKSLGVTPTQAVGSVGSMLSMAQQKLPAGTFDQIAKVIPGASQYLDGAKALGLLKSPITDMAGLSKTMSGLGIKPETAAKMVPAVTDYVTKASPSLGKTLAGVFG